MKYLRHPEEDRNDSFTLPLSYLHQTWAGQYRDTFPMGGRMKQTPKFYHRPQL